MTRHETTVGNVMMAPEENDSHRLETDTDDGLLVIVSGPSGVGKPTLTRGLGHEDAIHQQRARFHIPFQQCQKRRAPERAWPPVKLCDPPCRTR